MAQEATLTSRLTEQLLNAMLTLSPYSEEKRRKTVRNAMTKLALVTFPKGKIRNPLDDCEMAHNFHKLEAVIWSEPDLLYMTSIEVSGSLLKPLVD